MRQEHATLILPEKKKERKKLARLQSDETRGHYVKRSKLVLKEPTLCDSADRRYLESLVLKNPQEEEFHGLGVNNNGECLVLLGFQ